MSIAARGKSKEWKTAARWWLRLCTEEAPDMQMRPAQGRGRTRIHYRVCDSLAMERVAPQWSKLFQDKYGTDKIHFLLEVPHVICVQWVSLCLFVSVFLCLWSPCVFFCLLQRFPVDVGHRWVPDARGQSLER